MKVEVFINAMMIVVYTILGVLSLVCAVFYGAYWHYYSAAVCALLVVMLWNDDVHEQGSLKSFFRERRNR